MILEENPISNMAARTVSSRPSKSWKADDERYRSAEKVHQSLHVRPVRDRGRHAVRARRDCDAVPEEEGMDRESELIRHVVAPDPLRKLDDRCASASPAHPLPRDRTPGRQLRDGPRGHRAYRGRSPLPRFRNRKAALLP